ncbi:MAG: phosphopantetheine-binding protein, partial [Dolichospermum sp.]
SQKKAINHVNHPQTLSVSAPLREEKIINIVPKIPTNIDQNTLSQNLLNIVSEKTGYPLEMLELSMDIEADLGIDSIKKVEILGSLLELYPDLPKPNPEEIGELRNLGEIASYMQQQAQKITKLLTEEIVEITKTTPQPNIRRSIAKIQ